MMLGYTVLRRAGRRCHVREQVFCMSTLMGCQ